MSASIRKQQSLDECTSDGKVKYLKTAGGKIICLRCQAKSCRTKQQCGRPAIKTSRTQKCLAHEGRPNAQEALQCSSKDSAVHSQATKEAKLEGHTAEGKQRIAQAQLKHGAFSRAGLEAKHSESIKLRQLEDVAYLIGLIQGPRTCGAKPKGYVPVTTIKAIKKLIALE